WRERKSYLRPGELALRRELVLNLRDPRGPQMVTGYREEDIQQILRGEECAPHRRWAGRWRKPWPGKPDAAAAKRILADILRAGPMLRAEVIRRAAEAGVTRGYLYPAAKALKVEWKRGNSEVDGYWLLPGQQPPEKPSKYKDVIEFLRGLLSA